MTAVFNLLSTSTSDHSPNLNMESISSSLLANTKFSKTLILQPPVSAENKPSNLLAKRYKASELGDLLLKKIKTQNSVSSNQGSPTLKENMEEYDSSMLEEIDSPSTRSDFEHINERGTDHRMIDDALLPQRSISTPIFFNHLIVKPLKNGVHDHQRQVKHALDVLQKKMMIEQNASTLRDLILKVKLAHDPLIIPPLMPSTSFSESPIKRLVAKKGEDEPEVIYGEVEYPFLSLSAPFQTSETNQSTSKSQQKASGKKDKSSKKQKSKNSQDSSPSQESFKLEGLLDIKDFLSATRAETQKSESDLGSSIREIGEALGKMKEVRKRKSTSKKEENMQEQIKKSSRKEKDQEKSKTKQLKKEMPSPLLPARKKLNDRRKSKWQGEQGGNKEDY